MKVKTIILSGVVIAGFSAAGQTYDHNLSAGSLSISHVTGTTQLNTQPVSAAAWGTSADFSQASTPLTSSATGSVGTAAQHHDFGGQDFRSGVGSTAGFQNMRMEFEDPQFQNRNFNSN